jgi:FG-GAP-like repeat
MKYLPILVFLVVVCQHGLVAQSNPQPLLYASLSPVSAAPGEAAFVLTVNGWGFVPGAVVEWNGAPRTTNVVSLSQLLAHISATDIAQAGTASITVVNPTPGGGTSNAIYFPVRNPAARLALKLEKSFPSGDTSVVGDFNNDGRADVVITNGNLTGGGGTISVYFGNGDGTFKPPVVTASADVGTCTVSGDVNGDGKLDLLCEGADYFNTYAIAFLNNGDGTFTEQTAAFGRGDYSGPIAVADFNGDGKLDAVTLGSSSGAVFVAFYLGNGDGTFTGPTFSPGLQNGGPAIFGDFNRDGKLDVAIMDYGFGIYVYLGNGDGTFQTPTLYYPNKVYSYDMAAVDINGDGNLDLLTDAGSVLLGNGDGTFTAAEDFTGGGGIWLGDFDGDGKLDVLTTNGISNSELQISLLRGRGDGTFKNPISLVRGPIGYSLAVADFNNDGKLDVLDTNVSSGTNYLLLQKAPN